MNQKETKRSKKTKPKHSWKDYNRAMQAEHNARIRSPEDDTKMRTKTAKDLNL